MNNVCINSWCRKKFKCNGGCAQVHIGGKPYTVGICYCPDCAWKVIKSETHGEATYRNLFEVCSRFTDRTKEKVEFT